MDSKSKLEVCKHHQIALLVDIKDGMESLGIMIFGENLSEAKKIAQRIVKCVNIHDGLVEALRPLKTAYTEPLRGTNNKVVGYNLKIDVKQHEAILQGNKAIEEAEAEVAS